MTGKIIKVKSPFSYEYIIGLGSTIECQTDCKSGDIIEYLEDYFVTQFGSNKGVFKMGDYAFVIPLKLLEVVETEVDLSKYGWRKASNSLFCTSTRWINNK